jgi:DNA mismatch repair protein MutL
MSPTISLLPDDIINKIAAGEVVESSDSVVKELVENSIDAKAKNIEIEIKAGGMLFIRVTDDGIGMGEEDLKKCILRHATSKVKTIKDIENIETLGFRGEALASIASISKMKIESRGFCIYVEGGEVKNFERCFREYGTSIEIKTLFYNVPARKKFQRGEAFLVSKITKEIKKLCLAAFDVSFKFISNGRRVLEVEGEKKLKKGFILRIEKLFGKEILKDLILVDGKTEFFEIFGFIGSPLFTKMNKTSQYLLMNGRSVFNPLISKAVKEGYSTRIEESKYPVFFLHLNVKNSFLDVNVHPQKKEIRLLEEVFIRDEIRKAVFSSFQKEKVLEKTFTFQKPLDFYKVEESKSFKEEVFEEFQQTSFFENFKEGNNIENSILVSKYFIIDSPAILRKIDENFQGVICIDLKAALSQIVFEKRKMEKMESQSLNTPFIVENLEDIDFVENFSKKFSEFGFEIRVLKNVVAIDAIPAFIDEKQVLKLFHLILEELLSFGKSRISSLECLQRNVAKKICIYIKSRKDVYTKEKAIFILEELLKCKSKYLDPLGEPIVVLLGEEEISKLFLKKRVF